MSVLSLSLKSALSPLVIIVDLQKSNCTSLVLMCDL